MCSPAPLNAAAREGKNKLSGGPLAATSHLLSKSPASANWIDYTAFYLLYSKQSSCQDKATLQPSRVTDTQWQI